jgi:UDP-galactopyranose mutase
MHVNDNSRAAIEASARADIVVVGSGFFGLTIAECAAREMGANIVVIEQRSHIGGNAFSYFDDETGIEIHKYGSHLFHTSNETVWDYVNRFTSFTDYRHRVLTVHDGRVFQMPINLATLSQFYGRVLTPSAARELLSEVSGGRDPRAATSLEDRAIAQVGERLYRAFIAGYTQKQWQTDPLELPAEIIGRLPVRFDFNDRYFSDTWEGLPVDGYGAWISRMADREEISVFTHVDYFEVRAMLPRDILTVYTGPIDAYFGYSEGPLAWRTLDFEVETLEVPDFQGTSVMNYADIDVPFTRIHEPRHLHPERSNYSPRQTVIMREFSRFATESDEPYYPIGSASDRRRLKRYRELADRERSVVFGGRLGSYQYLDMHMAIASALQTYRNSVAPRILQQREASS